MEGTVGLRQSPGPERWLRHMHQQERSDRHPILSQGEVRIFETLAILGAALSNRAFLVGPVMSIADFFLTPNIYYFEATPEGRRLLPEAPSLISWQRRMENARGFSEINTLP
jgi:glutathione S-transferase